MDRKKLNRWIIYLAGMIILAFGITLNTTTGLGVSPIISVSYSSSYVLGVNFGNMTLVLYSLFVVIEIILHLIRNEKKKIVTDLLQLPLSIVVTRLMNLFAWILPDITYVHQESSALNFTIRFVVLLIAIVLTGIGAAMSLYMRIVPNPGDGIVQALADFFGKDVGFTKNCFDLLNIVITFSIGFFTGNLFLGIGIGTIAAMIDVGRVIALFHRLFWLKLVDIAGLEK